MGLVVMVVMVGIMVIDGATEEHPQRMLGRKGVHLVIKLLHSDLILLRSCHYHVPLLLSSIHLVWSAFSFSFTPLSSFFSPHSTSLILHSFIFIFHSSFLLSPSSFLFPPSSFLLPPSSSLLPPPSFLLPLLPSITPLYSFSYSYFIFLILHSSSSFDTLVSVETETSTFLCFIHSSLHPHYFFLPFPTKSLLPSLRPGHAYWEMSVWKRFSFNCRVFKLC